MISTPEGMGTATKTDYVKPIYIAKGSKKKKQGKKEQMGLTQAEVQNLINQALEGYQPPVAFPEFDYSTMPIYQLYGVEYPELELPTYTPYGEEYPEYGGALTEQAEDVISRMLSGQVGTLPVEELMEAYSEQRRAALEEYLPKIRESWAARGLLRSGMAAQQELEAAQKAARDEALMRAQLERESIQRQQDFMRAGLPLAAQMEQARFGAQQAAYEAARDEAYRAYQSALQAGMSEWEAQQAAWQAGREEYQTQFKLELQQWLTEHQDELTKWQAEFNAKLQKELAKMGYSAQEAATHANAISAALGGIGLAVGGPVGGLIGGAIGALFG